MENKVKKRGTVGSSALIALLIAVLVVGYICIPRSTAGYSIYRDITSAWLNDIEYDFGGMSSGDNKLVLFIDDDRTYQRYTGGANRYVYHYEYEHGQDWDGYRDMVADHFFEYWEGYGPTDPDRDDFWRVDWIIVIGSDSGGGGADDFEIQRTKPSVDSGYDRETYDPDAWVGDSGSGGSSEADDLKCAVYRVFFQLQDDTADYTAFCVLHYGVSRALEVEKYYDHTESRYMSSISQFWSSGSENYADEIAYTFSLID